jgi:CheY-like chemotaxis protein
VSQSANPPKNLLIVDDDRRLARMLGWSFDDLGYATWSAGTVAEAAEVLGSLRFDFALVDLGLPDGSGAELGMRLLDVQPRSRVALMSADRAAVEHAASQMAALFDQRWAGRIAGQGKPLRPVRLHRWFSAEASPAGRHPDRRRGGQVRAAGDNASAFGNA